MSLETELIIFDLGGVVIPECGDIIKKQIANMIGIDSQELDKLAGHLYEEVSSGKKLLDFYSTILNKMKIDRDSQILLDSHLEIYKQHSSELNPHMLALINKLKKRCNSKNQAYKIACLSNTEYEIAQLNWERGLFEVFKPYVFLSCDMGLRKPQTEIYQKVLDEIKTEPAKALFIDNNSEYIGGAEKLGIPSILYQNIHQLQFQLSNAEINCS